MPCYPGTKGFKSQKGLKQEGVVRRLLASFWLQEDELKVGVCCVFFFVCFGKILWIFATQKNASIIST